MSKTCKSIGLTKLMADNGFIQLEKDRCWVDGHSMICKRRHEGGGYSLTFTFGIHDRDSVELNVTQQNCERVKIELEVLVGMAVEKRKQRERTKKRHETKRNKSRK